MQEMNLFDSENKSDLVHYKGKLGDFWYDPKEFEITGLYNFEDHLHYCGKGKSVNLPEGCINISGMFENCELPDGFTLGENFNTSNVVNMERMFLDCVLPKGFSRGKVRY